MLSDTGGKAFACSGDVPRELLLEQLKTETVNDWILGHDLENPELRLLRMRVR